MDYAKLGLGKATSVITNTEIANWGDTIIFSCLYDDAEKNKPYQIVFDGCREFHWVMFSSERLEETYADFIGISLGKSSHKEPAIITTDVFEVTVSYGDYTILKSW